MSSAGATDGAAAFADEQRYFCHQCHRTFTLSLSAAAAGLACIHCHGDFVEEFDVSNPNPNPDPNTNPNPDPNPNRRVAFVSYDEFGPDDVFADLAALREFVGFLRSVRRRGGGGGSGSGSGTDRGFGGDGGGGGGGRDDGETSVQSPPASASGLEAGGGPEPFDPVSYLLQLFENIGNGPGAGVQVMMDLVSGTGGEGGLFGRSVGDYFIGPGLERLIEQLAENDPNRYGTPPASKNAVESLPDIKVSEGLLASDEAQCSVCMDAFELGAMAKQMPCKHVYHKDCILPWLELHNSCPVCRYELPTDDPDYESKKVTLGSARNLSTPVGNSGGAGGAAAEAAEAEGEERNMTAQRGFSFSQLFGLFGSDPEDSNSDNTGGSDNPAPGAR